jgi:hypothetical protein
MKHQAKITESNASQRPTRADALAYLASATKKITGGVKKSTAQIRAIVAQIAIFREGSLLTEEEAKPFIQMKIR